ncbi:4Fe-4S dicluster domain-containing protein [Campylobacter hyointestinalis]|uniref:4Fe-4S dicluster domain-containing protein n=1 Tax=Campylobacter hyointestinalis TaxID=198 RepID=UPI000CE2F7C1|nr:4Fe-4S dicluster domain-containing protein [Campylobacter hyointestinalis]MBT0612133.1 4Fe-4S dicluster domain-containing protein [Campylobacter hyointestinalis subsp. hyointestinalis]MDL2347598.1 4Fe-4S dicluster domain-containing protein [Campylobacter hyointestinalis]MDL2349341.1 4Fe-4S dicluster domain-containing protein [Campylobacter hyointestinalis]MDL2351126.1 4Fe-4S dicluster domain-containing protein [Campylobacter hyointestinalis]MDM1026918.1 4Fe-4S dicluster domain-containing pr
MNRREFAAFSIVALSGAAITGVLVNKFHKPRLHLRPPGSAKHFESLCIKCGQCVQVCPYHSIDLLGVDDGINLATAYIDPSKRGCYLCDLFPCVLACPSGALDHNTTTIADVSMGVAVVKDFSKCYANLNKQVSSKDVEHLLARETFNEREEKAKQIISDNVGKACSLCIDECPVKGAIKFIEIDAKLVPKIEPSCVGCGVCEEVCFANVIEILPDKTYNEIYKENS